MEESTAPQLGHHRIVPPRLREPWVNAFKFFWNFRRDPLASLDKMALGAGGAPLIRWRVGPQRMALALNPDAIQEVLVGRHASFVKGRGLERAKFVLGEGLLTSEGEPHKRSRRVILPAFRRECISGYAQAMGNFANRLREKWVDGTEVDIHREMLALTLQTVGKTMFGKDLAAEAPQLGRALDRVIDAFPLMAGFPWPRLLSWIPLPYVRRFNAARKELDRAVMGMIQERRNDADDARADLLSLLVAATDAEGRLSDAQLRDETMTIFLAGHETIAGTLTWAWHCLAKHPEVEARLHAEIDAVVGDRPPTAAEALGSLPYTYSVISETLRLYPTAWIVGRQATEAVEIAGELLPKGVLVLSSQWISHHDPKYFPHPLAFRPERWTPEFRASLPRFAFYPFGGGPRQCIGENFAWMEAVILLATLARKWRLRHVGDPAAVACQASITLRPKGGLPMRLERRPANYPEALTSMHEPFASSPADQPPSPALPNELASV